MRKPLVLAIPFRAIPWAIPAVLIMAAFLAPGDAHAQGGGSRPGQSPLPMLSDAETNISVPDPPLAAARVDGRLAEAPVRAARTEKVLLPRPAARGRPAECDAP